MDNIEKIAINTIRFLSVDAIEKAHSGHPGMPLGAAPMAYVLWAEHLKHNPGNSMWCNRDRFVLSAGHGSMLLYSLLHLFGYDLSLEDLKVFRQLHSKTPGHPEYRVTDGVEATSGPLGQGIAMAVGMAMAEEHLAAEFNRPGFPIVDHYTYVLCGDACLMEGVSSEASSLAGTLGLGKLILLYDRNHITIEGDLDIAFAEDVEKRYTAYGWQVLKVDDGDSDTAAISEAISAAKTERQRPTLIIVNTTIGYGCPSLQGRKEAHGNPLGAENISAMKQYLGWEYGESFFVPMAVKERMRELCGKFESYESDWNKLFSEYSVKYPEAVEEYERWHGAADSDIFEDEALWQLDGSMEATRVSSGAILNQLSEVIPQLFGGSADLNICNMTELSGSGYYSKENRRGRNIHFGVREFAMAAICNGIALHGGLMPYCGTFLVFLDYLKAALRLSAIMHLPVLYILTHDSIGMGEDGVTHQPVEQLAELRATPGVYVFRPADAKECVAAYQSALSRKAPFVIALSRQNCPQLTETGRDAVRGGYIVWECEDTPALIIIGTGSEVSLCIEAAKALDKKGVLLRVVSMPCLELFEEQDEEYKEYVLPDAVVKRLVVEAGSSFGWSKYAGTEGAYITVDNFGLSAPCEELFREFGFTVDNIVNKAVSLL